MKFTKPRQKKFLKVLAATGNVADACHAARVSRGFAYRWRAREKNAAAWDEAIETAADALEREAFRRAVEGVDEPVYFKGEVCGAVKRYSDGLLAKLLCAARPEKYRERSQVTHEGEVRHMSVSIEPAQRVLPAAVPADEIDQR